MAFKLTNETEHKLRAYIYRDLNSQMHVILGYTLEESVAELNVLPKNSYFYIGSFTIQDLLQKVELPEKEESNISDKVDLSKSQFIFNTLYAADHFVTDDKDRSKLKDIISKIPITKDNGIS